MKRRFVMLFASWLALFVAGSLAPSHLAAAVPGQQCAGLIGIQCDSDQFCEFPANQCGIVDNLGICTAAPSSCAATVKPVCGCDLKTYDNDCKRQYAGVSKAHDGKCD